MSTSEKRKDRRFLLDGVKIPESLYFFFFFKLCFTKDDGPKCFRGRDCRAIPRQVETTLMYLLSPQCKNNKKNHLFFFKKSSGARQETTTKKKTFVKLFQREKDDPLLFGKTIAARRSRMLIGRLLVQHITSLSFPIRLQLCPVYLESRST